MRSTNHRLAAGIVALLATLPASAQTQINNAGSVTAAKGWDFLQWTGNNMDQKVQGFTVTSTGGTPIVGTVADQSNAGLSQSMLLLDKQPSGSVNPGWYGKLGPKVLYSPAGPLQILFSGGVYGVGVRIEPENILPFTGSLELLDSSSNVIGSAFLTNVSTGNPGFLGAMWNVAGIYGVRINANVPGATNEFAIGDFGVRLTPFPSVGAVPEPGEWAAMGILGSSLGLLALRARRKRPVSA
jgi:hypothetical protein